MALLAEGVGEIYVMNADGSGQVDLTNTPGQDGFTTNLNFVDDPSDCTANPKIGEVYHLTKDANGNITATRDPVWQCNGGLHARSWLEEAGAFPAASSSQGMERLIAC
ncbi:MAG TPA: hypothetical protein VMH88_09065 [Gemmatimonadales bacterium]|nr:hypothetical protein [Gemmatimonadales bacterium]